jgi:hypothetical protein
MIRTTAGNVKVGSPWLQPLPMEVRGPLAGALIRQTDGTRTILREKLAPRMGRRPRGFSYVR